MNILSIEQLLNIEAEVTQEQSHQIDIGEHSFTIQRKAEFSEYASPLYYYHNGEELSRVEWMQTINTHIREQEDNDHTEN